VPSDEFKKQKQSDKLCFVNYLQAAILLHRPIGRMNVSQSGISKQSLGSYGRCAFAVVGPTAWNSLSDDLCDQTLSTDSFRRLLKTRLFSE